MKKNKVLLGLLASGFAIAGLTQSCISDMPFADGEGEGTLRMQLVVNSDLTRADDEDDDSLRSKCVVYLSGKEGLLYKYQGLENVPQSLKLKSGSYVAEAWTGDSVTASFDKRFFRGVQPVTVTPNSNTSAVIICKIANVVVSLNPETVDRTLMKDWKITVSNSRGSLVFDESNMDYAQGYFMMPNADIALDANGNEMRDKDNWPYYTNLTYKIEGTAYTGQHFEKTGLIGSPQLDGKYVQRAHEYVLNLVYGSADVIDEGGAFVTIVVNDQEVEVNREVGLYSRPAIKGANFDIEHQIQGNQGTFKEQIAKVTGFGQLQNIKLSSPDYADLNLPSQEVDLLVHSSSVDDELKDAGISWDTVYNPARNLTTSYITFSKDFMNKIPKRDTEYRITVFAKDSYGKTNSQDIRIAVGEGAIVIDDPITIDDPNSNLLNIRAYSAILTGKIINADLNPRIEYKKQTDNIWNSVAVTGTRAADTYSVKLNGLDANTVYEYRIVADDYQSSEIRLFRTESIYTIPNGDMENWTTITKSGKTWAVPGLNNTKSFWDNGNEGASTISSTNVCEGATDIKRGNYSAKLQSKKILGLALAAGNLFVGEYGSRDGIGAKLTFGKPYEGASHPEAMNVWVNYTPASVSDAKNNLKSGEKDHGQIYIAFTSGPVAIHTSGGVYFDPNGDYILGYGEKTWAGVTCGNGNELEKVNIPIKWNDKAKTVAPTHIVIVCSASKYGDYMEGGNGSVMYVDDFELVY